MLCKACGMLCVACLWGKACVSRASRCRWAPVRCARRAWRACLQGAACVVFFAFLLFVVFQSHKPVFLILGPMGRPMVDQSIIFLLPGPAPRGRRRLVSVQYLFLNTEMVSQVQAAPLLHRPEPLLCRHRYPATVCTYSAPLASAAGAARWPPAGAAECCCCMRRQWAYLRPYHFSFYSCCTVSRTAPPAGPTGAPRSLRAHRRWGFEGFTCFCCCVGLPSPPMTGVGPSRQRGAAVVAHARLLPVSLQWVHPLRVATRRCPGLPAHKQLSVIIHKLAHHVRTFRSGHRRHRRHRASSWTKGPGRVPTTTHPPDQTSRVIS